MSVTSALERIHRWTEQHDPEFVALLQPGLSRHEIETAVSVLPFALAEEVYELYQWRNGQSSGEFRLGLAEVCHSIRSCRLKKQSRNITFAQAESYEIELEWEHSELAGSGGWLPVAGMERYYKATLGTTAGSQSASILGITREGSPYVAYVSLVSMLEYHADVYEAGALRTDKQGGDFFDYTIVSALKRQHFQKRLLKLKKPTNSNAIFQRTECQEHWNIPLGLSLLSMILLAKSQRQEAYKAEAATERYLAWLLGDAEQATQITQTLIHSPYRIMYGSEKQPILVRDFVYSFLS